MVLWLVGLSGAGKSSIARALEAQWPSTRPTPLVVDGDDVRMAFGGGDSQSDHSVADRRSNAERINGLVRWLDSQGKDVVVAVLSIFPDLLVQNRLQFKRYVEIYLSASIDLVESRDPRGLYAARRRGAVGNVVGVDIPFPTPQSPDLTIFMDTESRTISAIASDIIQRFVD